MVCTATAENVGQTGVEMEALTAVQVALLTIYDICKAADRGMVITDVKLLEKHGGKSGSFVAERPRSIFARLLPVHLFKLLPVPLRQVFLAGLLGAVDQAPHHARLGRVMQHGLAGRQH